MEAKRQTPHIQPYTVEDYEQWQGRWELWDGQAISMSPSPNWAHQDAQAAVLTEIRTQLAAKENCRCRAVAQLDWRIDRHLVLCPDISVVCDALDQQYITQPPWLIIEFLSPATASYDRLDKRMKYSTKGVAYYFIVEPEGMATEALQLEGDTYKKFPMDEASGWRVPMHEGCDLHFKAGLLRPVK